MWNILRTFEKFKFDSKNCWSFFNTDMNQTKNLCLLVSQCRIATESFCVSFVLSTTRYAEKIIAEFANDVKMRTRRVDRYVLEFASIFFR